MSDAAGDACEHVALHNGPGCYKCGLRYEDWPGVKVDKRQSIIERLDQLRIQLAALLYQKMIEFYPELAQPAPNTVHNSADKGGE